MSPSSTSQRTIRTRIAPRPRPLTLWHFTNPRHWTVGDIRQASEQGSQSFIDQVVLAAFRVIRTRRSETYLRNILTDALTAIEAYDAAGWLDDPRRAHADPAAPDEWTMDEARVGKTDYLHLRFPTAYVPYEKDPSSTRWERFTENRTVHAYVLQHDEPRPWVVNVHGAGMGGARMDLRLFRANHLHHTLGLNVIQPVLPLHGPRTPKGDPGNYPSESVMHNLHGALQGVNDVRRAIAWVREQQPGQPIGINGISLGGFTSALVASLEPELACAILGVAPVDLVMLLEAHHGTGSGYDLRVQNFEAGARLSPMISPLKLTPAVPWEARFMYAGIVDRLVDYSDHVAPMIAHWDYPEVLVYDGGHVGIGMAKKVPGFIDAALTKTGLARPAE
jgi:pimeloyl-ACP methyl ester carboxylesterase